MQCSQNGMHRIFPGRLQCERLWEKNRTFIEATASTSHMLIKIEEINENKKRERRKGKREEVGKRESETRLISIDRNIFQLTVHFSLRRLLTAFGSLSFV